MNARRLSIFVTSVFMVAEVSGQGKENVDLVHLRASVWAPGEGAMDAVAGADPKAVIPLSHPSLLVQEGAWATFFAVRELIYPTQYEAAVVPESLVGQLRGGGIPGMTSPGDLPSADGNGFLPPFPHSFATRNLGMILKVRPTVDGEELQLEVDCKYTVLNGFRNLGEPIRWARKGALGQERNRPLLLNRVLVPEFASMGKSMKVRVGEGPVSFELVRGSSSSGREGSVYAPLAGDLRETFGVLKVRLEAERVETGLTLSEGSVDSSTEKQSWRLSRNVQACFGVMDQFPSEEAVLKIAEVLKALRIPVEGISEDGSEMLQVSASKESLERIDRLVKLYEHGPQIHITLKCIELDEPLDGSEGPLLTEEELTAFLRQVSARAGTDLLSAPSVVARPYQKAKIEVVQEFIFPVDYDPPEMTEGNGGEMEAVPANPTAFQVRNMGVTMEISPVLLREDRSLEVEFSTQATEFLRFLDFGAPIMRLGKGVIGSKRTIEAIQNQVQMPVFGRRELSTRVRVPNGSHLLLGGMRKETEQAMEDKVPLLGDLPVIGGAARSEKVVRNRRFLYTLVGFQLIDPAGTPIE